MFAAAPLCLLDTTVVLSFDRSGFLRHARAFDPRDLQLTLPGKTCLVTGANSGLGLATSSALAAMGASVRLLCRDRARGEAAMAQIRAHQPGARLALDLVDLSDLASVHQLARALPDEPVHVLVHNAGVLPDRRVETRDGLELTWATNVIGPFLLTALLLPRLRAAAPARVIVVSSGGMYPQRLDLTDPLWHERPFDGVRAYALSKRAQVVLTELWAQRLRPQGITVNSMHPGWADTPAVRSSLPRFHRLMRHRLRSPEQGADTIVWLAACERLQQTSGLFWFDRQPRRTVLLPGTRETAAQRRQLWQLCCAQAGLDPVGLAPVEPGA